MFFFFFFFFFLFLFFFFFSFWNLIYLTGYYEKIDYDPQEVEHCYVKMPESSKFYFFLLTNYLI